ncbi:TIAM1 [Lepeophtheirus salmonis]|uniref:TIAM1 n=1 Tax=Lepeophtheirus salmonis TaxID=72036 RepID=A0A7R8D209_LEPSM|nr:TIAM1 [Lepeophtheirus salmonis]CAF2998726.1 TIAM1 [Lepeophtheirus salmonis]
MNVELWSLFVCTMGIVSASDFDLDGTSTVPRTLEIKERYPNTIFNFTAQFNEIEDSIGQVEEDIYELQHKKIGNIQKVNQDIDKIRTRFTEEIALNGMSSGVVIIVISIFISFIILGLGYQGLIRSRRKSQLAFNEGFSITENV